MNLKAAWRGLWSPAVRADASHGPADDFWFLPALGGAGTHAGYAVGPDTVMRVSTVFACVSLKAETLGQVSCDLFRRTTFRNGVEGKEKAKDHRLYRTCRRPNASLTAMDFYAMGEARINLRGITVAKIEERRDRVDLIPIQPKDLLKIETLDTGRLRFEVRDPATNRPYTLSQDEVLYVRDLMTDGLNGLARASLAREAIAVSGAMEGYVGKYFENNATGGLMVNKKGAVPDETQRAKFRQMLRENFAGWRRNQETKVFYGDVEVTELGQHTDAGFLIDPRNYQVEDIARFFGRIPLWMIGMGNKDSNYGTGIAEQKQGWIDFGMMPSIVRWEQAMNRDLLLPEEQDEYYFKFNVDGLERGDLKSRSEALEIQRRNGVISPNEWRGIEDKNPREDDGGDEYLDTPVGAGANEPPTPAGASPATPAVEEPAAIVTPRPVRAEIPTPLIEDAAQRITGEEVRETRKRLPKAREESLRFMVWARQFAADHRAASVRILTPLAEAYGVDGLGLEVLVTRIEQTAVVAMGPDGPPEGWLEGRKAEVAGMISDTFRSAAALAMEAA